MKKYILLLIISLFIFTSCEELGIGNATLKYEIYTESESFSVAYDNKHGNEIFETVNNNTWSKEFDCSLGEVVGLDFMNVSDNEWVNAPNVYVEMSISKDGDVLVSYTGETNKEYINCIFE
tara:strand:+ start:74 stop:436 length:363 start_codon:yes stop_codon:yes gene_type:complete